MAVLGVFAPKINRIPASAYRNGKVDVEWYLTQKWNEFYKTYKRTPKYVFVSQELFGKFEARLVPVQRWVETEAAIRGEKQLAFKSCKMAASYPCQGWEVMMI